MPDQEIWRPVAGYGEEIAALYEVSDMGRVRSAGRWVMYSNPHRGVPVRYWKDGRVLRPGHSGREQGYRTVHLYGNQGSRGAFIHELVLRAFVGPRPEGFVACHGDGDGSNNTPENLRWDTYSANNYDRVRHGRHPATAKTHCPRGHALEPPNLDRSHATKGHRACAACLRACRLIASRRRNGRPLLDVQETADRYYAELTQGAPGVCRRGHMQTEGGSVVVGGVRRCGACHETYKAVRRSRRRALAVETERGAQ